MKRKIFLLALCCFSAGLINGIIGTGGGIALVFALTSLCKIGDKFNSKDIFATCVACILPISLLSAASYIKSGNFLASELIIFLTPAPLGGILGGFLLDRINSFYLKKIFSLLVLYAGVRLIFGG